MSKAKIGAEAALWTVEKQKFANDPRQKIKTAMRNGQSAANAAELDTALKEIANGK